VLPPFQRPVVKIFLVPLFPFFSWTFRLPLRELFPLSPAKLLYTFPCSSSPLYFLSPFFPRPPPTRTRIQTPLPEVQIRIDLFFPPPPFSFFRSSGSLRIRLLCLFPLSFERNGFVLFQRGNGPPLFLSAIARSISLSLDFPSLLERSGYPQKSRSPHKHGKYRRLPPPPPPPPSSSNSFEPESP